MKAPYTDSISIAAGEGEMTLFAREIEVQTDAAESAEDGLRIQSRLGYPVYDTLLHALCHFEGNRGTAFLVFWCVHLHRDAVFPISLPIRLHFG